MNAISLIKIIFSANLILALSLPLQSYGNENGEGSSIKKDVEGSASKHEEGSSIKKHVEGSSARHEEGSGSKKHVEGSGTQQDQEAMMAKWQEFATPNDNHKVLDTLVGKWNHTVKWSMSADAEPEESTGSSELKWIMGGRFLQHTAEGISKGQPFEGMGIIGYDNGSKEYTSFWLDNMGTGFMEAAGQYDPNSQTLKEEGHFSCPFRGKTPFRGLTKIEDNDRYTFEVYSPGFDGKEFRTMEITYTRKK